MPSIFSHALFAAVAGRAVFSDRRVLAVAAFCSIVPDFDVVAFIFRIPYSDMFGHRGITHSIAFAALLGAIAAALFRTAARTDHRFGNLWALFSLATFSHPLLDMLTNGGLGVALFAPISNHRFFFPWRPVEVSPIGAGFFSAEGVEVMISEFIWIWIPAIVVSVLVVTITRLITARRNDA